MRVDADIAIIGSGFAGSLMALALSKVEGRGRGRRVVLVERARHPRFVIGESSTPLANLLLEELADKYDLPQIRVFSKWGTWQRARPDVSGGLKRGFTFYFHRPGEPFADDEAHARQLMVAASPHDEIGDTHWYRPDFDLNLVREAEAAGAIYLDETTIDKVSAAGSRVQLEGTRGGASVRIEAALVVDASGPRGFLAREFNLEAPSFRWLPHTRAVYTHFENVERWDALHLPQPAQPPYPPDDAAVHHVFPGGWIWVLRFNNGITSAGAAFTDSVRLHPSTVARGDLSKVEGQADRTWAALLAPFPSIREQFRDARAVAPWFESPRLAFRTSRVCGPNWALLPSAAGVIDPLLSTGFPLALLGIHRLLRVLEEGPTESALREYERVTLAELDATEHLVAALYASMSDPQLFKRLTLLYFAAASFTEAARRLKRPDLAPGFLLDAHPQFGPELHACCDKAPRDERLARIDRAIEPFDIAGLLDRSRRDWYPARADDLVANAAKLDASANEIELLLERSGFARLPTSG
jgi:FADH2 O2-dependent halogenase